MTVELRDEHVNNRPARAHVLRALITVALIVAAFGLAPAGLDALNDLLARGLTSLSNPSM